ncbi:FAD:protein FMN transferase [Buchananella hordeovulneris]|nr:FAD:protein FMN transferase [Buchananella hordeovulneris]
MQIPAHPGGRRERAVAATLEFDALGTRWWLEARQGQFTAALRAEIATLVADFVHAYSRFEPTSLLNQLGTTGTLPNPPTELLDMLTFARDLHAHSGGVFNISIGGALEQAGYGSGPGGQVHADLWQRTHLSPELLTVPAGVRLDLGGFGKGWLIDKLAEHCRAAGLAQIIVNGGGDLRVISPTPVSLALEHPYNPQLQVGQTQLTNGGLAVSSTVKRVWVTDGVEHHHLFDPTTAASSSTDVVTVYVKAPTARLADAVATILMLDPTQRSHLETTYGAQAIVLRHDQLT